MFKQHLLFSITLLLIAISSTKYVNAEQEQVELYKDSKFALGIGAAIVRFDTNIKATDKQSRQSLYLDLEGNLDLPEVSTVTTFYGMYQLKPKHSLGFSFFSVNRASDIFNFDKTLEDVHVTGYASITDTTDFYRLDYGYNLYNDNHSKIDLIAGIYGLDLKYVFKAEGDITIGGVKTTGSIKEEAKVFAPLPLIGLDFLFRITNKWSFATKVALVTGSYEDLSATVFQTSINSQYRVNQHFGIVMGLAYFDADVVIENDLEKQDISYGYDGAYIGMHFVL
ncbi:MAG: hypothetical protein LJE83_15170 [Gammaproteobacteria bacterium]|jgi:hypothetical protein|nr:hypothetical protein [Gammaproteobacteria bacterium]